MEETVGKFGYLFGIILSLALIALGILVIRKNAKSKSLVVMPKAPGARVCKGNIELWISKGLP